MLGSPVFIDVLSAKQAFMGDSPYITGNFPSKYRLMGIIHGHFDSSDRMPDLVVDDGNNKIGVNMGVAMVIPAEKIVEVFSKFAKDEEAEMEEHRKKKRSNALI